MHVIRWTGNTLGFVQKQKSKQLVKQHKEHIPDGDSPEALGG